MKLTVFFPTYWNEQQARRWLAGHEAFVIMGVFIFGRLHFRPCYPSGPQRQARRGDPLR